MQKTHTGTALAFAGGVEDASVMNLATAIAFAIGSLAASVAASEPSYSAEVHVHPLGTLHGDETLIVDGERWLALVVDVHQSWLIEVPVVVEEAEDSMLDEPGELSGRKVSVPDAAGQVLMLFTGPALRAGPVVNSETRGSFHHGADFSARIRVQHPGVQELLLGADCDQDTDSDEHAVAPEGTSDYSASAGEDLPDSAGNHADEFALHATDDDADDLDCRLWLESGDTRQVLARYTGYRREGVVLLGDGAPLELLFAGDLDNDGRSDLLIDLSPKYNAREPTLFLSGKAEDGKIVREVGSHRLTGC